MTDDQVAERPAGELWIRSAQLTDVRFRERIIDLVVMPYDEPTMVLRRGRLVKESVAPGSFDGIQRRADRVKVNRDHDVARCCGKAITFHPSREEGLVAELRMARTPLGDETLQLAEEGILDASAGFLPMPGGEEWRSEEEVRLTRLWLGHIAMTPDPAYAGAQVLAVRSAAESRELQRLSATPGLDQVRTWLLDARYSRR